MEEGRSKSWTKRRKVLDEGGCLSPTNEFFVSNYKDLSVIHLTFLIRLPCVCLRIYLLHSII